MDNLTNTAAWLADKIANFDGGELFEIESAEPKKGLPLVAWRIKKKNAGYDEYAIASHMRQSGWILPSYSMPPHMQEVGLLNLTTRTCDARSAETQADTFPCSTSGRSNSFV